MKAKNACTMVPGHQAIFQPFYICHTCSDTDDFGVCAACAESCHKGHQLYYIGEVPALCDCQSLTNGKCMNCPPYDELKCTNLIPELKEKEQVIFFCDDCRVSICGFCAMKCHLGHNIMPSCVGKFECNCGLGYGKTLCKITPGVVAVPCVKNIEGHCTIEQTGKVGKPHEKFYFCMTCGIYDERGVCEQCAKHCHEGHKLIDAGYSSKFYCDCGNGTCVYPCKLMNTPENKCTLQENGIKPIKQKLFECMTCGLEGKLHVCEKCALVCHAGHDVKEIGELVGTCDCCSPYPIQQCHGCCGECNKEQQCHGCCGECNKEQQCHGCCGECNQEHQCHGCCRDYNEEEEESDCCCGCNRFKEIPRCILSIKIEPKEYKCSKYENKSKQNIYKCLTCNADICESCSYFCHKLHDVQFKGEFDDFKCSCNNCKLPQIYPTKEHEE